MILNDSNLNLIKPVIQNLIDPLSADELCSQLAEVTTYEDYYQILLNLLKATEVKEEVFAAKLFALNLVHHKLKLSGHLLKFLTSIGDKISKTLSMSDKDIELAAASLLSYERNAESIFDNGEGLSGHVELVLSFQSSYNAGELILKLSEIEKKYCFKAIRKLAREATSTGSEILDSSVYKFLSKIHGGVTNIFNVSYSTSKHEITEIINKHDKFILAQGCSSDTYYDLVNLMFGEYVDSAFVCRVLGNRSTPVMNSYSLTEFINSELSSYRPYFSLEKDREYNSNSTRIAVSFEKRISDAASNLDSNPKVNKSSLNPLVIYMVLWSAVRHGHFRILEEVNAELAKEDNLDVVEKLYKRFKAPAHHLVRGTPIYRGNKKIESLSDALECSDDMRSYKPKLPFVIYALPDIKARDIRLILGHEGANSLYSEDFAHISFMDNTCSSYEKADPLLTPIVISKTSIGSNIRKTMTNGLITHGREKAIDELSYTLEDTTQAVISDDYLYALSYLHAGGRQKALKEELPYLCKLLINDNQRNRETLLHAAHIGGASNRSLKISISFLGDSMLIDFITKKK